jgi:hypothetical protein
MKTPKNPTPQSVLETMHSVTIEQKYKKIKNIVIAILIFKNLCLGKSQRTLLIKKYSKKQRFQLKLKLRL